MRTISVMQIHESKRNSSYRRRELEEYRQKDRALAALGRDISRAEFEDGKERQTSAYSAVPGVRQTVEARLKDSECQRLKFGYLGYSFTITKPDASVDKAS